MSTNLGGTSEVTYVSDGKNKKTIDISELERVYGSLNVTNRKDVSTDVKHEQKLTNSKKEDSLTLIELAVLREKLDTLEVERKREQFEERIEQLQDTLNKTTLLLEHYTKEGRGDEWSQSIKSLEERISNQVKANKEEQKNLMARLEEKDKALGTEKNKSFLKCLFG